MKKILIPTDFSSNADNAANLAVKLASNSGASLHFIHVVFTPTDWVKMTDTMKSKYPESQQKILDAEAKMANLISKFNDLNAAVESTIEFGNTIDRINAFTRDNQIDLIIVGSHGTSNKADLFIGSNTQRLMRSTHIPVIAVKDTYQLKSLDKIVFASSLDREAVEPYKKLKSICESLDVSLELLYVNTPYNFKDTDEIEKVIHQFAERVGFNNKVTIRNDYDVANGILMHCQKNSIQMAALINHRKAMSANYLMGVTETLVFHADFPIISVNISY